MLAFAATGEGPGLARILHLPLPGSVLRTLLLWAALGLRFVRLDWLEGVADTLLGILGLLFVPATVGRH